MSKLLRRVTSNQVLLIILALAAAVLLSRLWGNGFTGGDEGYTATARMRHHGFWNASYSFASEQDGRFYGLFVYTLAQIPYLFDSLAVVNVFRIATSGLAYLLYFFFIRSLFGTRTAVITGFIYLGLVDTVGGGYNAFHALPNWYNTGMSFLFGSFLLYIRARRRKTSFCISYAVFFLSLLTYEPILFYAGVFPFLFLATRENQTLTTKNLPSVALEFLRQNLGLFCAVGLYLAAYVVWRRFFPIDYPGLQVSWTTLWDFLRTVLGFSINGIYVRVNPEQFLSLNAHALIFTGVLSLGLAMALRSCRQRGRTPANWVAMVACVIFAIAPSILFGLSERYRNWPEPFYHGSYYAGFSICLLLALVVDRISSLGLSRLAQVALAGAAAPTFVAFAYANQVQSLQFFGASRIDARHWPIADALAEQLRSDRGKGINVLCTRTFLTAEDAYDYWSYYLTYKVGRPITVAVKPGDAEGCDAAFIYQYPTAQIQPKRGEGFVVPGSNR